MDGYGPVCRSRVTPAAPSPARTAAARHTGTHTPAQLDLEEPLMDHCEDCNRSYCRDCGGHYCCEPCPCERSHNCDCECRGYDRRLTDAD